jgi:anion-transporting  ArsA/GET3 family ATPase
MGLKGLKETSLKLILFGGKGGVGKTTCASIQLETKGKRHEAV